MVTSGDEGFTRLSRAQLTIGTALVLAVGGLLGAHALGGEVAARESLAVGTAGAAAAAAGGDCAFGPTAHGRWGRPAGCPAGRQVTADELVGTWLRTGVDGVWRGDAGREFLRFDRDGGLTWGFVGPYRDVRGRYVLTSRTVTVAVDPGGPCGPLGGTYTWWATVTSGGRLHLAASTGASRDGCSGWLGPWSGRRVVEHRAPGGAGR